MKTNNTPTAPLKINRLTVRTNVRAGAEDATIPTTGGRPITIGYTWTKGCY